MARIAAAAGIRQASLYTHFESRRAILLAALDVVYERIYASRETPSDENSLERLRQMCDHHLMLWATQGERHHAHQLLEYVSGARGEGLREILAEKHMASIEQYAQVVRDGQKEGKIPAHVDPEQVAWFITGWAFAGDVSHLMGFKTLLGAQHRGALAGRDLRQLRGRVAAPRLRAVAPADVARRGSAADATNASPKSRMSAGSRARRLDTICPLDYYLRSRFI